MARSRGVRGAASLCAVAALLYLLARAVLYAAVSGLLGLVQPGASLARPVGVSDAVLAVLQILIGLEAILLPLWGLLRFSRLQRGDLRILLPAPWSPAFCLPVFLGAANAANLAGALLAGLLGAESATTRLPSGGPELFLQFMALCVLPGLLGAESATTRLPSGGPELFLQFMALCVLPAVTEELFFRGALQGLLRPCGSAVAIFGPALLFSLLHLDAIQGLTALVCGVFLGWLAERSGSILPGILLHFVNNCLAFCNLYLRLYAPGDISFAFALFVLLFFPLFSLWLLYHARKQGFHFSAGLRPGVDVLGVFTSPAYTVTVVFLLLYTVFLT